MDKIHPTIRSQFNAMDFGLKNITQSYLSEYDVRSIMHYSSTVNGLFPDPVIKQKDGSLIQGNTKMSDIDIKTLNKMYPCVDICRSDIEKGNLV